jgi:hypothetical protein
VNAQRVAVGCSDLLDDLDMADWANEEQQHN